MNEATPNSAVPWRCCTCGEIANPAVTSVFSNGKVYCQGCAQGDTAGVGASSATYVSVQQEPGNAEIMEKLNAIEQKLDRILKGNGPEGKK
jgi:hypothetical protein